MGDFWSAWNQFWGVAGPIASVWSAVGTWYSIAGFRLAKAERAKRDEAVQRAEDQAELARVRRAAYEALEARVAAGKVTESVRAGAGAFAGAARLASALRQAAQRAVGLAPRPWPRGLAYRLARFPQDCHELERMLARAAGGAPDAPTEREIMDATCDVEAAAADVADRLGSWGEREDV